MKLVITFAALSLSMAALAADTSAISSKEAKAAQGKVGKGMVTHNGKNVFKAEKACSFFQVDFETEATDRDVLVIGYDGRPTSSNDFGVNPQGHYVGNQTFWEAGVYYDAATKETRTATGGVVKYEVCYGKPNGAFASACTATDFQSRTSVEFAKTGVTMSSTSRLNNGKLDSWTSTCKF